MKVVKKMVEETVYETDYGEVFDNREDCLYAESNTWLKDMSKKGIFLNIEQEPSKCYEDIHYIVGIGDKELKKFNEYSEIRYISTVECEDANGNFFWCNDGNCFKSLNDFLNVFSNKE